jgi:hypothetical protein
MRGFEAFEVASWLEQGLLVVTAAARKAQKASVRAGASVALAASVFAAPQTALAGDQHLVRQSASGAYSVGDRGDVGEVPAGYWERVVSAVAQWEQLPEKSSSLDELETPF